MRVLITGATGLIGRRVVADRLRRGDEAVVLSRSAERARRTLSGDGLDGVDVVEGDPVEAGPWQRRVDGCDAVVHLAGAGVADRRWTRAYKRGLRDSRVESTRRVVDAVAAAGSRPAVLVNASAVGYYGDRGDDPIDETAPAGDDFLARLAVEWEAAALAAGDAGTRVVLLRTGVVLDPRGAALGKMLPIFRLGLGGRLGSGRQWLPWIHWRDVVGLADLAIADAGLTGPLNVVAPGAVRNRAFARALGRVLRRPAFIPTPAFALRLIMGEMGSYAIVSQRVVPAKAGERGYAFAFPELDSALEDLVCRS